MLLGRIKVGKAPYLASQTMSGSEILAYHFMVKVITAENHYILLITH